MTALAEAEASTRTPIEGRRTPAWSTAAVRFAWVLIALGALLRLRAYLHFRSLWIDESMLALNITHRSAGGLLHPLSYAQASPAGFLLSERFMVNVFGPGEYSLRFIPFAASVTVLPLFFLLVRRLLGPRAGLIALGLMCFSSYLIYYGAELKQYSTDCLVSVILLLVFARASRRQWDVRAVVFFALTGAVAIWCAHPAVFVVGAFSAFAVISELVRRRYRSAALVAGGCVAWLASFAGSYELSLRTTSGNTGLQGSWGNSYLPFPPHSLRDLVWPRHVLELFRLLARPVYATVDSLFQHAMIVVGIVLVLLVLRRRLRLGILLCSPLVVMLVASAAHKYPFAPRLMTFYVPFIALIAAVGLDELAALVLPGRTLAWRRTIGLVGLSALFALPVIGAAAVAVHPSQTEEMRGVLRTLRPSLQQGIPIVVYPNALPAFIYYSERMNLHTDLVGPREIGDVAVANSGRPLVSDASVSAVVDPAMGKSRIWLLVSHQICSRKESDGQLLLSAFAAKGAVVVSTLSAKGVAAYLLDTRSHEGHPVPAFAAIAPLAC